MKKYTLLPLLAAFVLSLSGTAFAGNIDTPSYRLSMVNYGGDYVDQYLYDDNGLLTEIVEYEMEQTYSTEAPTESYQIYTYHIHFDETGSITGIESDRENTTFEIPEERTWVMDKQGLRITTVYNEDFLTERSIIEIGDFLYIDSQYRLGSGGIPDAVTRTTTDLTSDSDEATTEISLLDYVYDANGNYIMQFKTDSTGRSINATYSWELAE